jgi:hypothetical protein
MRRASLALVTCCILALGGCGDDDSSSGGDESSESTTERTWTNAVNSKCRENNRAADKLVKQLRAKHLSGTEFVAQTLERSIPQNRRMLSDLRSIAAPAALRSQYLHFLDRIEDSLPLTQRLADSARSGKKDPGLNDSLQKVVDDTRPFAQEHGLTDCLA